MAPGKLQMWMRLIVGPYAVYTDIANVFLMVGLDNKYRDFTLFLWPGDHTDPYSPDNAFRFKVILF